MGGGRLRLALAALAALAAPGAAMVDPDLDAMRASTTANIKGAWLATVDGEASACSALKLRIEELSAEFVDEIGVMGGNKKKKNRAMNVGKTCVVAFQGPELLAEAVRKEPGVREVSSDMYVFVAGGQPPSWGLNRVDQHDLPLDDEKYRPDYSGNGVNIFVVDTGINYQHVDFDNRAKLGLNVLTDTDNSVDDNGHGSHCAGSAAGATYGVAPGATVYGVKVLSATGSGSIANVIEGIEWAVDKQAALHGDRPGVISLSLGGSRSDVLNKVVEAAAETMIVVVAAGNDSGDACNHSPASAGGKVITVGSTTATDARSSFSNYGKCVDIFAPGSAITSTWAGSRTATNTISGTSMATPHVAGVAAQLLEKNKFDMDASIRELLSLAVPNRVDDARTPSNLLLQVALAVSLPPTPQPTRPPTLAPPQVCGENECFDYMESLFGPRWPGKEIVSGPSMSVVGDDYFGCSPVPNGSYKGAIVLVPRGACKFFVKVKIAEDAGAVAVIHFQTSYAKPFPPNYYDGGTVNIPSLMISYVDARALQQELGSVIEVGSPSLSKRHDGNEGKPGDDDDEDDEEDDKDDKDDDENDDDKKDEDENDKKNSRRRRRRKRSLRGAGDLPSDAQ